MLLPLALWKRTHSCVKRAERKSKEASMPEILLPAVTTARLHRIALTLPLTSLINEHLRLQISDKWPC
ncbi:Uncharacterized protein APZ42_014966 [Daphnia magna]|uniref:Uncharacterized protein n=1 Tax=Daphnia magna TaxID=35525 RepID=A0A162P234_9CRUS|nr:Uncharacterized protein APZ42_014966 [Daphnia magna]